MMEEWQISSAQKKLLDELFNVVEGKIENVLDIGSGRTSIFYLTDRYKNLIVEGIIYPGDERKIGPIKECVKNTNYELIETDISDFKPGKTYDVILGHLFLGEAEKFAGNKFGDILKKLFSIKTKYLVLENLERDNIDFEVLDKYIASFGIIIKQSEIISEGDDRCLGMTIRAK